MKLTKERRKQKKMKEEDDYKALLSCLVKTVIYAFLFFCVVVKTAKLVLFCTTVGIASAQT